jgi:leucyl-tRNA synthetase
LESQIFNPITQQCVQVVVTSEIEFPLKCDICLGVPAHDETHEPIARQYNLQFEKIPVNEKSQATDNTEVLANAKSLKMGGTRVSSKLKDWLVSRQRFWGTPIPIVHCESCGTVPVKAEDLPVKLPETAANEIGLPLSQHQSWIKVPCPNCGESARRETDTLDTFVDSAWYFLRYIDPHNPNAIFDKEAAHKTMPVDLYVGGKEHAFLHLYYARFINHFLHTRGLVPGPEPFKRLLVQGMVNGKSFRLKGSGQYLTEAEVEITDAKKNKAIEKSTGAPVVITWEKMSKSKFNGVDPADVINAHGCDTTRLIILGDVAPTSHRNWSSASEYNIIYKNTIQKIKKIQWNEGQSRRENT